MGNSAAAFIQADAALRENVLLGGEVFFVPDNTPLQSTFKFVIPYLESRGFSISQIRLPYTVVYGLLYLVELVLKALSPLVKIPMKATSRNIKYLNTDIYFHAAKAQRMFNFTNLYSPQEAKERSLAYYKAMKL